MELKLNSIYQGDVLKVLRTFPDECIDLIFTSPPYYGLRNYGVEGQIGLEKSFEEYLEKMLKITAELKRVLKETGQLWWNHGDCYGGQPPGNKYISEANRGTDGVYVRKMKRNRGMRLAKPQPKCLLMQPERLAIRMIDEQQWILRNKVVWAKQVYLKKQGKTTGSVMPTSVKDRFNESWEYLYFFVKNKKYYSDLDAVRIPAQATSYDLSAFSPNRPFSRKPVKHPSGYEPFNLRVRDAERKAGQPGYRATKEEIGRYKYAPADHRGPNDKTGKNYGLKYYKGKFSGMGKGSEKDGSPRSRAERKYGDFNPQKAEWKGTTNTKESFATRLHGYPPTTFPLGKNIPTVWQINPEPHNFRKELGVDVDHFAVFPQALVETPIKFGCPKGGVVLDPFAGSGTTLLVAKRLGCNYIGIELNPDYITLAEERLRRVQRPML